MYYGKPEHNVVKMYRRFSGSYLRLFAQVQGVRLAFEKKGYEVIGYASKSPDGSDSATRLQHLQEMVNNLGERSLGDKTYVSISSLASSPFNERNSNVVDETTEKLEHVTESTPDILEYLQSVE